MNKINLKNNWKLYPQKKINADVENPDSPAFNADKWYDARIPSTVMAVLVENNVYSDPYFGTNLKEIPGRQFESPWVYRTEFMLDDEYYMNTILLSFDGINYKANIRLNGKLIADTDTVKGAFRRFQFDISDKVVTGNNILVVEVTPPGPGDFSIGFVDWNPNPPDKNMGIFRDVTIEFNKGVSIHNPFVETKINSQTHYSATLDVSAELKNHTTDTVSGILKGSIGSIVFSKEIIIESGDSQIVRFSSKEFSQLIFENPELWWPNGLGEPNLYDLRLSFMQNDEVIDETSIRFGIREIEDYVNKDGHRGFVVNGHKVLIRGAGWSDDLLLQDTHESLQAQIGYVRDMNLNCIRLEGFWGKDQKLYDLCDENGILIMVGWSCQWEHEEYLGKPVDKRYGGVIKPDEIELIGKSWEDQVLWLRHHPSIFVWTVGSDLLPHPDLERKYIETFDKFDRTRPYLNSTGGIGSEQGIISDSEIISELSGSSRVKMLGPYAYTPPVYWYTNKNLGGAYGFNTETCPGANIPPVESIKKMIPGNHLWPIDDVWNFHCGKNVFSTIDRIRYAIDQRYGKAVDVIDFAMKAQVLNYELMRPMFEAFQANQDKATGIIQWMLNSAWPEMYWQLYDSFLMPNGAYYGAKKANEALHLLFNYGDDTIQIVNNSLLDIKEHKAIIRILDINSREILKEVTPVSVNAESGKSIFQVPKSDKLSAVYFIDLRLLNADEKEISNNFYWLSAQKDVLDYDANVEDWTYYTPSSKYADFTLLNTLPGVQLDVSYKIKKIDGNSVLTGSISNNNPSIAFFVELLLMNKNNGETILPVFWYDNYLSILPDEKRNIHAKYKGLGLTEKDVQLKIKGWNVPSKAF